MALFFGLVPNGGGAVHLEETRNLLPLVTEGRLQVEDGEPGLGNMGVDGHALNVVLRRGLLGLGGL